MSGIIGVSPDMRSGVIGKYPAGQPIQFKMAEDGGHASTDGLLATTSFQPLPGITLTMTPASTSSTFWIDITTHIYMTSITDWLNFLPRIMSNGSEIYAEDGAGINDPYGEAKTSDDHMTFSRTTYLHSPNSTSNQVYVVQAKMRVSAGTMKLNWYNFGKIAITELA